MAPKEEQAAELREMLDELISYLSEQGVDLKEGLGVTGFDWVAWLSDAAEALLVSDDVRRGVL